MTRNSPDHSGCHKVKPYWLLWSLLFGGLFLDQLTKYIVWFCLPADSYSASEAIPVIRNLLYIVHVHNPGASWGMLSGWSVGFAMLAIVALAIIFISRRTLELRKIKMQIAFGLLCGGIIGNLIDRLLHGYVIDFIDVHLPGYRWPAFNVADACICVGVFLYCAYVFFPGSKQHPKP